MTGAMWATLVISALMLVSALAAWREAWCAAKDAQTARFECLRISRLMGMTSTVVPPSEGVSYAPGHATIYGYLDPDGPVDQRGTMPFGFGGDR